MRYISILVLLVACATENPTKLDADTCFFGVGQTTFVYEDHVSLCSSEFKLRIKANHTFQAEERRVPLESAMGIILDYSGVWQPLENGKILLIAEKKVFSDSFSIAYDSAIGGGLSDPFYEIYDAATYKGIQRIDVRSYMLDLSLDSVSLGKGIWLQQNRCDSSIRLRRK